MQMYIDRSSIFNAILIIGVAATKKEKAVQKELLRSIGYDSYEQFMLTEGIDFLTLTKGVEQ